MKSEYSMKKKNGYLYFAITGEYNRADFMSYATIILNECDREKINKVLVDTLHLKGTNLPDMERYGIGEKIAELFPPTIKLAVAWPERDINKFVETVAVNRGGFMKVTGDLATAEKWLLNKI